MTATGAPFFQPSFASFTSIQSIPFGPLTVPTSPDGLYLPIWVSDDVYPPGHAEVVQSGSVLRVHAGPLGLDIGRILVRFALGFENLGANAMFQVHSKLGVNLNTGGAIELAVVTLDGGVTNQNDRGKFSMMRTFKLRLSELQALGVTYFDMALHMEHDAGASRDIQITEVFCYAQQITPPSGL